MISSGVHLNAVGDSAPYMRKLLPDCVPTLGFFTNDRPSLDAQVGEVINARLGWRPTRAFRPLMPEA